MSGRTTISIAVLIQCEEDTENHEVSGASLYTLAQATPGQILLSERAGNLLAHLACYTLSPSSGSGQRELVWQSSRSGESRSDDDIAVARFIEQKGAEAYATAYPPAIANIGNTDAQEAAWDRPASGWLGSKVRLWMIGGAAAVVLLLATLTVRHFIGDKHPPSGTPEETKPSAQTSSTPPAQISNAEPSAESANAPVAHDTPAPNRPDPKPSRTQDTKRVTAEHSTGKPGPATSPITAQKAAIQSGKCEYEPNQLPALITKSDTTLERGDFEAAERQVKSVLACEPGNGEALKLLDKVRKAIDLEARTSKK